jgi:hypothetical protein
MPPHLLKYANREDKEMEVTEKIRLLMLLKKVRDENLVLKMKLKQRVEEKMKEDLEDYSEEKSVKLPSK